MATPQQEEVLRILSDPEAFLNFDPSTIPATGASQFNELDPTQPGAGTLAPGPVAGPPVSTTQPPASPFAAGPAGGPPAPVTGAPGPGTPFISPQTAGSAGAFAPPAIAEEEGKFEEIARSVGRAVLERISPELTDLVDRSQATQGLDQETFRDQRGGLTSRNRLTGAITRLRDPESVAEKPISLGRNQRLVTPKGEVLLAASASPDELLGQSVLNVQTGVERFVSEGNLRDTQAKLDRDPDVWVVAPKRIDQTNREGKVEEEVQARGKAIQMLGVVNQLRRGGTTVGFRGRAADIGGGLAETFIGPEAGVQVASFLSGGLTDPAAIRVARTNVAALALQHKEYLTGEGTNRISDSERDLVLNKAAGLNDASSDEQVAAVFLEMAGLSMVLDEIIRREKGEPLLWDVSTDEALEDSLMRMERILVNPEDAEGIITRLVLEHEKVKAFGG